MTQKFADIHVHTTQKPFNNRYTNGEYPSLWEELPQYKNKKKEDPFEQLNCLIKCAIKEMARKSQTNLDKCVKADLRCVFLGLYPSERKFFDAKKNLLVSPLIEIVLPKRKRKYLGAAITGFQICKVKRIMERIKYDSGIDYFNEEFLPLIMYVVDQQDMEFTTHQYQFKIATTYEEFEKYTEIEKETIAGILTVEGVSSLGRYRYHKIFDKTYYDLKQIEKMELAGDFEENITKTKNLNNFLNTNKNYTPFFISFSHHFNNLLAGHARSFSLMFSQMLNQKAGMNEPFNPLGLRVLHLLLSRDNGRRILIDTKHMSIQTRRQYHCIVKKRRLKGDRIPIICSHTAVNGLESFEKASEEDQRLFIEKYFLNKKSYFKETAVNLNDDEILDIFDSDGLIGIVLHEDRMPGGVVEKLAKKYKKVLKKYRKNNSKIGYKKAKEAVIKLKRLYLGLIWSNIFHIIRLISKKRMDTGGFPANGWKIISLGSDFDGTMNPFDTYKTVEDFPDLANDMISYLEKENNPVYYTDKGKRKEFDRLKLEELFFKKEIKDLVDDIFWNNTSHFLEKYFHDEYLKGKTSTFLKD